MCCLAQALPFPSLTGGDGSLCFGRLKAQVISLLLLLLSRFSRVQLCATPETQPTRLPRPWDSPGKNTGVGCHFLLQCVKVKSLSRVRLFMTPWTAAHQAPPPMGFSRQEYWSGVPLPSPVISIEGVLAKTGQGSEQCVLICSGEWNCILVGGFPIRGMQIAC